MAKIDKKVEPKVDEKVETKVVTKTVVQPTPPISPEKPKYEDITLKCVDCPNNFVFSAKEQEYYHDRGLATPKRCVKCRLVRRAKINGTVQITQG